MELISRRRFLEIGAATFGVGWGLVGLCPGPALENLATLSPRYPGLRVGVTGLPAIYSDEMKTSNDDMMRSTLFALAGVALLFVYAYKSVARPVISVICIGVGVIWTFGFVALTLGYLNLLAMVFAVAGPELG